MALGFSALVALVAIAFNSLEGGAAGLEIAPSGGTWQAEEDVGPEEARPSAPSAITVALSADGGIL